MTVPHDEAKTDRLVELLGFRQVHRTDSDVVESHALTVDEINEASKWAPGVRPRGTCGPTGNRPIRRPGTEAPTCCRRAVGVSESAYLCRTLRRDANKVMTAITPTITLRGRGRWESDERPVNNLATMKWLYTARSPWPLVNRVALVPSTVRRGIVSALSSTCQETIRSWQHHSDLPHGAGRSGPVSGPLPAKETVS